MTGNYIKWAEININNLEHNITEIRRIVGAETKIAAVVKANGYGHGALELVEYLLEAGADMIAVSSINEAIEIRKLYKKAQTLVLGYTPEQNVEDAIRYGVIQTVISEEQAQNLSEAAGKIGMGVSCHIKIDTGMNRIGFKVSDSSLDKIERIFRLPNLQINGIYSHFATADEENKAFTKIQFEKFLKIIKQLEERGIKIPVHHIANSAAIIDFEEAKLDMVRPGIILYGIYPSNEVNHKKIDLKPVMSLKTQISHLKVMEENEAISYGLKDVVKKGSIIATIPIGYADGYTRRLSGEGTQVIVRGRKALIRGNICMDQCMVEVTDIPEIAIGDEVVLFGESGGEQISVDELSEKAGKISYEILSMIGRRVPRIYIKNGQIVKVADYLL